MIAKQVEFFKNGYTVQPGTAMIVQVTIGAGPERRWPLGLRSRRLECGNYFTKISSPPSRLTRMIASYRLVPVSRKATSQIL